MKLRRQRLTIRFGTLLGRGALMAFPAYAQPFTAYSRYNGVFWDSMSPIHLKGVRDSDIKAMAQAGGDFDDLRHRFMSKEKVVAEILGRQLQEAARKGNAEQARQLLGQGAAVNYQSFPEESTALVIAVANSDLTMVRLLLKHRADVTVKDDDGKTALNLALAREAATMGNEDPEEDREIAHLLEQAQRQSMQ